MRKGKPLDSLTGKHVGELVFLVGNSASLDTLDMKALGSFTSLGVNRILRLFTPTYVFVVDGSVLRDEKERLLTTPATKLIYRGALAHGGYRGQYVDLGTMSSASDPSATGGPIHICRGGNSAYEAAQVLYRMGAKQIAIAGVDMYWPPDGKTHFFGKGSKAGCRMHRPEEKTEDFARMKRKFRKKGVEMFSVSPWETQFRTAMGYIPLGELTAMYCRTHPDFRL